MNVLFALMSSSFPELNVRRKMGTMLDLMTPEDYCGMFEHWHAAQMRFRLVLLHTASNNRSMYREANELFGQFGVILTRPD